MRPIFNKKSIGSIEALSDALQVNKHILQNTADNIFQHYHPYEIKKKDGGTRLIHIPTLHLKIIQKRINKNIFDNVTYPDYLHGGIEDKDYVKNALSHANAEAIICLDIKNFYPSITQTRVSKIFQYFFKFPEDVSNLLAKLCCHEERVPQGACTSSHLANLAFFDSEYHFASFCKSKKYTYTRLLDDITISKSSAFSDTEISKAIASVKSIISPHGIKLNNKKQKIVSRSNPKDLMEVTGLWLNRGRPRAHRSYRKVVRLEMHICEKMAKTDRFSEEYHKLHNRVSGKVSKLSYLGHHEATNYRDTLQKILPLYDIHKATNLHKNALILSKVNANIRKKFAYFKRYSKINYELNILARNNKPLSKTIRNILSNCKPSGLRDDLLYNEPI
ncbi:reverse transcriptase family protein [Comamonas testosteroni]|uniref:reverse transcriptase family protein n=1 Tax=Comamonas testosteroni TaxID=285 RepID=UPI0015FB93BA|nr:reverse transcriptase family protein [Comamonas testosteroni]